MKCKNCGGEVDNNSAFCTYCGNAVKPEVVENSQVKSENLNKPAISQAKLFAILGFAFSFFVGIAGIVLSAMSLKKYKQEENQEFKGMAVAGLILSILNVVFVVGSTLITVFFNVVLPFIVIIFTAIIGSAPMIV